MRFAVFGSAAVWTGLALALGSWTWVLAVAIAGGVGMGVGRTVSVRRNHHYEALMAPGVLVTRNWVVRW